MPGRHVALYPGSFDPITFGTDLERLRRYYEARGYYNTSVEYDLDVDDERDLVVARVEIREGLPAVSIASIDVEVAADPKDPKPPALPEVGELDDILRRLTEALRETGQAEDTLILISSDNGPHMETWPDAAYTPFRCAKGSTWEGGVRVPGIVCWPGMIEGGQVSDGLFDFNDILPTLLALAGGSARLPEDRYIDGIDQSAFLLTANGLPYASLLYVWMLDVPAETVIRSPYTDRVRMIVVESGAQRVGEWVTVRRNVLEDYRRAFAEEANDIVAVGLMTDSGDDGSRRHGFYGDITFRGRK